MHTETGLSIVGVRDPAVPPGHAELSSACMRSKGFSIWHPSAKSVGTQREGIATACNDLKKAEAVRIVEQQPKMPWLVWRQRLWRNFRYWQMCMC